MNSTKDDTDRLFLDRDDSGHWYLVDANKRQEWNDWLSMDQNDPESWTVPSFATKVCGGPHNVTFICARDEADEAVSTPTAMHQPNHAGEDPPEEPTHYTGRPDGTVGGPFVMRHPSQIEKEKREAAYYLRVIWPEICGDETSAE